MRASRLSERSQLSILLVDDEVLFLSSLKEALARRFATVAFHCAEDGEAAMDMLGRHAIDLVVTDLKMPKLDGFGLLARMSSRHPGVPALVMTAYGTEATEQRAIAAGAIQCIDKPVDLDALVEMMARVLDPDTQGTLRGVSLPAFLQLLGMERLTGVVQVGATSGTARLYLRDGQLVHAEGGGASGLDVALRTVALDHVRDHVQIELRQQYHRAPRTIHLSLTELLLEAARHADEASLADSSLNIDDAFSDLQSSDEDAEQTEAQQADNVSEVVAGIAPNVRRTLEAAMTIDGALGVALIDSILGTALDSLGGIDGVEIRLVAAASSEIVRAKMRTISRLELNDSVEDILMTLGRQYHVIRMFAKRPSVFVYLVLDRARANLGMARFLLAEIERHLTM